MQFLILKTGTAEPALRNLRGDFDDQFLSGLGFNGSEARVVDARSSELPDPTDALGIAITGSSSMVTDCEPWSLRVEAWLASAVGVGTPVLGVCYGHQLLARSLGGTVGWNPWGRELGTVSAQLEPGAEIDPLFSVLPRVISVQSAHSQSVQVLPRGAQVLARSSRDPHLAFRIGAAAWGVQFHPEFDAGAIRVLLEQDREDGATRAADCAESPDGLALLRRFAEIARKHGAQRRAES